MNSKSLLSTALLLVVAGVSIAQPITWKKYSHSQGAFTVEFQGEPKITETTNQTPEGYSVKVKMFAVQESGNVCYVLFNEMEAGVNILADSVYLNTVTDQILEKFGREPKVREDIKFEGTPGKHFIVEFPDGIAEGKIFLRTNRAYFVVSFFPRAREADRKKFLESFHFLPYQKMGSVAYQSKDHFFKINFPVQPKLSTEQNEDGSPLHAYYGMDPLSGNNYSVAVDKYSPYIQFKSDSAVLADRANGYTLTADSIISIKDVIVDGRPGKDIIINQGTNNFKMRVRVFTNGYYSYTIFTFLPYEEIQAPPVNQFFDSFRFTAKVPGNLLTDKSELMLKDIESNDTTILKEVIPFVEAQDFTEKYAPRIQELLLKQFDDDSDTVTSRKIILLQSLGEIKSASSVEFIKQLYPTLKGNPELEFNALDVLVKLNTKEANTLLLELLPSHSPVKGNIWKYSQMLSYSRIDSAEAKEFFFHVLPMIKQSPYKTPLYSYMEGLMRDKGIQYAELTNYKPMILSDFKSQFESFTNDTIYQFLDDLTIIVGYDKPGKSELDILKKLASGENDYLAIRANAALLRQQQKANDKKINSLAQNLYFRKDLYSEFKDFNLEKFFPKAYLNQDSIAVSEMFSHVTDEYVEPVSVKIIHSEILTHNGQQKKFYVIQFTDPEDGRTFRGVAGPYPQNKIDVFAELTGSFLDEHLDKDNHEYLVDYLSNFEQ
jgi:hypothetical protein